MTTLTELHQTYDGPIPQHALAVARLGSSLMVELVRAEGQARFFKSMLTGQIAAIRSRKADGSYYPSMANDLALDLREWRRTAAGHQARFDARL
jgi:hypothetical protein